MSFTKSLAKNFDPSNCAANFDGPKTFMPCSSNLSFKPSTNGNSGPMNTTSDLISLASLHIPSMSSIATFIHFGKFGYTRVSGRNN